MSHSSRKPSSRKPASWNVRGFRIERPYPSFPLSPHYSGKWMKRINGRLYYFHRWAKVVNSKLERLPDDGWKEALELYERQAGDLHAGRTPQPQENGLTVVDLLNAFFTAKKRKLDAGEIVSRTFTEYKQATDIIAATLGKTDKGHKRTVADLGPNDFAALRARMAESWGPVRLAKMVGCVKSVFRFGTDNGLIKSAVQFGSEFVKPGKAVLRRHKAQSGKKAFTADECRTLLDAADPQMKCFLLLALNGGFGPHDLATLTLDDVDLESGFIRYARPKTGIERSCPLWPETISAIREYLKQRPQPVSDDAAKLLFLRDSGKSWISGPQATPICVAFKRLAERVGIYQRQKTFYYLRHTFQSVADAGRGTKAIAIGKIMGHADSSMAGHYREYVNDDLLFDVVNAVHVWLFGGTDDKPDKTEANETDKTTWKPRLFVG